MEAKEKTLNFINEISLLKVPFFQRGYVWDEENWEELLLSMSEDKKSQFLGSIILKLESELPFVYSIIDGQQRLTTITILLKALYDILDDSGKKNINEDIRGYLFSAETEITKKNYKIRIEHSKIDKENYEKIIGKVANNEMLLPVTINDDDLENNKIFKCYKFFRDKIKEYSSEQKELLFKNIKTKNMFVLITLDKKDNDQQIFDTINSAGIKLTGADIIKNALFEKLVQLTDNNKEYVYDFYLKTWNKTFCDTEELIDYWNTEKSVGRYKKTYIEILLQAVAIIKRDPKIPEKSIFDVEIDKISDLSNKYKSYINTLDQNSLEDFITEIIKYADIYKNKIPDFKDKSLKYENLPNNRVFHILDKSENTTFIPYILFLFDKYKDKEEHLSKRLHDIEKLVVTFLITKDQGSKNFNKFCSKLIKEEDAGNYEQYFYTEVFVKSQTHQPFSDEDIFNGIKSIKSNKNATLLLFWIELKKRFLDKKAPKELNYVYSLEHVMPQNLNKWKKIPYVDDNGNEIPYSLENELRREERIYSLGNMTLITKTLNSTLINETFENKKTNGLSYYGDLFITKEITSENCWNEAKILEREKRLAKDILSIWGPNS